MKPLSNMNMRIGRAGFTLIELLVTIGIILILMGLVLPTLATARQKRLLLLANQEVKAIYAAATNYYEQLQSYPPDTGEAEFNGGSATTAQFNTGVNPEPSPPDATSIYRYLGREIVDRRTGRKYPPFLQLKQQYLKDAGTMDTSVPPRKLFIYLDPWNRPYRMDALHTAVSKDQIGKDIGKVTTYGEPYPPSNAPDDIKKKLVDVKVWSAGPDGEWGDGSETWPEDGKGTDPGSLDNITSWAD